MSRPKGSKNKTISDQQWEILEKWVDGFLSKHQRVLTNPLYPEDHKNENYVPHYKSPETEMQKAYKPAEGGEVTQAVQEDPE